MTEEQFKRFALNEAISAVLVEDSQRKLSASELVEIVFELGWEGHIQWLKANQDRPLTHFVDLQ